MVAQDQIQDTDPFAVTDMSELPESAFSSRDTGAAIW